MTIGLNDPYRVRAAQSMYKPTINILSMLYNQFYHFKKIKEEREKQRATDL
jgi:hypothetical protein